MTFNYTVAAEKAKALIEKFGAAGSFVLKGSGGVGVDEFGDPLPPAPDVTYSGTVTPVLAFKANEIGAFLQGNNESIQVGDSYVFFDSATPPVIGAITTINGDTWRVVAVESLTSVGGVRVFTKLQLRR